MQYNVFKFLKKPYLNLIFLTQNYIKMSKVINVLIMIVKVKNKLKTQSA